MAPDVTIIGGGIWGLSIAFHLRRSTRLRVLVLERRSTPGAETTGQAAGHLGLLRGHALLTQGVRDTLECLRTIDPTRTGAHSLLTPSGSVSLATSLSRLRTMEAQVERGRRAGVGARLIAADQAARLVPGLRAEAVVGGCMVPEDGFVDPRRFAATLARAVERLGGRIQYNTMVEAVTQTNQGPRVTSSRGVVTSGACVLAAGPWTARLLSREGVMLPAVPIRLQQALTGPHTNVHAAHPIVRLPDDAIYLRPEAGGYLFGIFEPRPASLAGTDVAPQWSTDELPPPRDVIEGGRLRLARVLPALAKLSIVGYQQGLTTFTPDALPLVGRVDEHSQILVACGCNGFGVALSGGIGRWMTAALTDPYLDPVIRALSPMRFASMSPHANWLRAQAEARYVHYDGEPVPPAPSPADALPGSPA